MTVDLLSGGRLVVGAGLGSLAAEFTAFGESADARQRAPRLDESLGLLEALWSGEPVTVRGEPSRFAASKAAAPQGCPCFLGHLESMSWD